MEERAARGMHDGQRRKGQTSWLLPRVVVGAGGTKGFDLLEHKVPVFMHWHTTLFSNPKFASQADSSNVLEPNPDIQPGPTGSVD